MRFQLGSSKHRMARIFFSLYSWNKAVPEAQNLPHPPFAESVKATPLKRCIGRKGQYQYSSAHLYVEAVDPHYAIWQGDGGSGTLLRLKQGNHPQVEIFVLVPEFRRLPPTHP
jgi:hypothetical protein